MKYLHLILLSSVLLSACAVGPDFKSPQTEIPSAYGAESQVKKIGTANIVYQCADESSWWNTFRSAELNQVIDLAMNNNYDLYAMQETLQEAKQKVIAQTGQLWPQVNLNAEVGRQKYGIALFGPTNFTIPPFTYYELGPSVNLLLDIFGGTRRSIEKQQALMTYQQYQLNAAVLTLTGNITTTLLTIATINEKIATTKAILVEDNKNLHLVEQAFRLGSGTKTDVLSARSQLENDETLLPSLYQQLSVARDALNVLTGTLPVNWHAPDLKLSSFRLSKKINLIIPSELVHKRPDILAAEATLHAANADVGIATANLYPSISLSGSLTQEALSPHNLFKASSNAWGMLGGLTAPLFNGGTLRAERRAAIHAYNASYANYQQVVLKAFTQVNDVIQALQHDSQEIAVEKRAVATATESLKLARLSYEAGNSGLVQILDAERLYNQARLGYVQAKSQLYQDTAQLHVVLGG